MPIIVYNKNDENHEGPNNYDITRPSILSNPFTHLPLKKTKALFECRTREEAIERYNAYFDLKYRGGGEFKDVVDEIYQKYRNGETIYLGCVCKPLPCHGDIIAKKMQQKMIKEKILELKVQKHLEK